MIGGRGLAAGEVEVGVGVVGERDMWMKLDEAGEWKGGRAKVEGEAVMGGRESAGWVCWWECDCSWAGGGAKGGRAVKVEMWSGK